MIGETVASYKIARKLGEGGMGEVYLAEHRYIARRAAIKFLLKELSSSESVVNRFFTEARAASLIQHPGIIEVQDCGIHTDGRAYMVMELLNGESVRGYLDRAGRLTGDPEAALAICAQVSAALAAAHAQSIVHRDLKPDNIFLHLPPGRSPATPVVKVLDFGIAKLLGGGAAGTNTRTGNLLGTPLYMSPEQCRGAGEIDSRSDVYSFGCIMYELLCGRPPFVYEGLGELIYAHISQPPPEPAGVAPAARDILMGCLAKDPKARPQTMDALSEMLAAAGAPTSLRLKVPVALAAGAAVSPAMSPAPVTPAPARPAERSAEAVAGTMRAPVPAAAGGTAALVVPPGPVTAAQASISAGGTQVLPTQTTFTQSAGQVVDDAGPAAPAGRRKLLFVGVGAAAAIAVVALALSSSSSGGREKAAPKPDLSPAATAPAPSLAPAPAAPAAAPAAAPKPAEEPPGPARVALTGLPPGASVTLDGAAVSPPLAIPRGAETHRVTVSADGYQPAELTVDGSRDRTLSIELKKVAAAQDKPGKSHHKGEHRHGGFSGFTDL